MPEDKTNCKKCGTEVLLVTAKLTEGFCAPCSKEEGTFGNLFRREELVAPETSDFRCCECGSEREEESRSLVLHRLSPPNPWSRVAGRVKCSECDAVLPSHLVFRESHLSFQEAQDEWNSVFRSWPQSNLAGSK